ncbi:MAG: RsbRD N-terminal domain-containing protein [candidate division Zixibacteria bacterium]|nr:RsbRD N-terminal domain-containing protein [candidate division Zixibacteria bacterium]
MTLRELLTRNKERVVEKWRQGIIDTYPADGRDFLQQQGDRFANPIGYVVHEETDQLFEHLVNDMDPEGTRVSLDKLIRIRAVQDFLPSEAVSFVLLLKPIVRELLAEEIKTHALYDELQATEDAIDRMQLMALDSYTLCRDRISEIKVNDARRSTAKLIERLNARLAEGSTGNSCNNTDKDNDR